ncbi:MAG: PD40 domain-containing protein, partial [Candidatus Helarchaeota archaeon]|nr:PD40 domain-containing protein [Candidatus Helarchaeota archaeon]
MKKIQIFVVILIFFFQILYSAEGGKKKLTIKDALMWKIPSSIAVSPIGNKIAFVVTKPDFEKSIYERNIWTINVKTGMVRQFTYGSKNEFSPEFSPDGRYISFIAKRNGKNEKGEKNQIWMIPVSGGEARKLTSAEEGVIRYKWSPDGENIFYTTKETLPKGVKSRKEKNKKIKNDAYVVDKENYRKEIWSINITTKKGVRVFKGDYGLSDIEVSPDGKKILYTTNYTGKPDDRGKFDLWVLSLKDGKAVQLTKREGSEYSPKWSPDGKTVAFLAGEYPEITYSQTDLFIVPSSGGKVKNITLDFDKSVSNTEWSKDGKNILCNVAEGFYTGIYKIDVKTGEAEPIIKGDLNITPFKLSYDGESLIYIQEKSDELPDIFISDLDGSSSRQLTYLNPEIEEFVLA